MNEYNRSALFFLENIEDELIREKAVRNYANFRREHINCPTLSSALSGGFKWIDTIEGHYFWEAYKESDNVKNTTITSIILKHKEKEVNVEDLTGETIINIHNNTEIHMYMDRMDKHYSVNNLSFYTSKGNKYNFKYLRDTRSFDFNVTQGDINSLKNSELLTAYKIEDKDGNIIYSFSTINGIVDIQFTPFSIYKGINIPTKDFSQIILQKTN